MNIEIETYQHIPETTPNVLRKAVWDYSLAMSRLLAKGEHARTVVRELRFKHNIVAREIEVMTSKLGERDWAYRREMIAALAAITVAYSRKQNVPAVFIRGLGNAIATSGVPQSLGFAIRNKGWLKVNLVALYVYWARHQHRMIMRQAQVQARHN